MTQLARLEITDGTTTVDLIAGKKTGFHLLSWSPSVANLKGGGIYQDSGIAPFRQLVFGVFDTVSEAYTFRVNGYGQDDLIDTVSDLLLLLQKARDYWLSDWQNTPVYLIAKGPKETNTRYGLIRNYTFRGLANPYAAPFFNIQEIATMEEISLGIERDHWTGNVPGTGTAVAISASQAYEGRSLGVATATNVAETVWVGNRHNIANLTDIYLDDGGVFGSNLMDAALPYSLLPAVPANNDALYFGIDTSVADSGPFSSLVFDIGTALTGTITTVWEYWNGTAWSTLDTVTTQPFTITGIHAMAWNVPSDWTTTAVNGVTGYWVRFRITVFTSAPTIPTQQNRDIYSAIWPYVDINSAQVGGELPALALGKIMQRIVGGGAGAGTGINRVIAALRSSSRGSVFTPYLNCSDEQEPNSAYSVSVGSDSAFANDISTATGRRITYNPGGGTVPYHPIATFDIDTFQTSFYGTYHVFVRCYQVGQNLGNSTLRVTVRSSGNTIISTSKEASPLVISDWQLLDLGEISFPPRSLFIDSNTFIDLTIRIEAKSASTPDVYLNDLILIPTDEWAGDVIQNTENIGSPTLVTWRTLNIDSIQHPKVPTRTMYEDYFSDTSSTGENWGFPKFSIYNGEMILQANASQRLYFLLAYYLRLSGTHDGSSNNATLTDSTADFVNQGVEIGDTVYNTTDGSSAEVTGVTATTVTATLTGGTDNDWDAGDAYLIVTRHWISIPELVAAISVQKNQRYLGMRGTI